MVLIIVNKSPLHLVQIKLIVAQLELLAPISITRGFSRLATHMAFYKYGFAFLAGTGFGAAMASLRNDNCPRRRHCRHHRPDIVAADESEMGERDRESYLQLQESKKGIKCPKKAKK